ncbi:MAG TPA: hypothetical protein VGJ83_05355 [Gemmatimonadales bacterium]
MGLHTLLLALQIAAPDSARLAAIARFHPGTTVRLQGSAIGLVEVRLRSPAGDTITVGRWQPERPRVGTERDVRNIEWLRRRAGAGRPLGCVGRRGDRGYARSRDRVNRPKVGADLSVSGYPCW